MATAASLSIKLGLLTATFAQDTKEARAQIDNLQRSAKNLGDQFKGITAPIKQFGSALSAVGIAAAITGAVQLADKVNDLAAGYGISAASVLKYRAALQESGATTESAQQALTKLYTALEKARSGDEASISSFQRLGISWEQLKRIKPEQALEVVTAALAKNGDAFEQVRLKRELFGKQNVGLDLEALSEKLKDNNTNWEEHARRLQAVKDVSDKLKISSENLLIAVASFIPNFTNSAISVEKFEAAIRAALTYFAVTRIVAIVGAVVSLASAIRAMTTATVAFNLAAGSTTPIGILLRLAAAGIAVGAALYGDKLFQGSESSDKKLPSTKELDNDNQKFRRVELEAAQAKIRSAQRLIDAERERLNISINVGAQSEIERKNADLTYESRKKIADLENQISQLTKTAGAAEKKDIIAAETAALRLQIRAEEELLQLRIKAFTLEKERQILTQTRDIRARGAFEAGRPVNETPEQRARAEIDFRAKQEILATVGAGDEGYSEDQLKIIEAIELRAEAERELLSIQENRVRQQQILTNTEQSAFTTFQNNLQLLGQRSKAAFALYKATAIAQAIIDTYKSATSAFAALAPIPIIGPALGYAAAAAAIAAGLVRVQMIRSQQPAGRATGGPVSAGSPYMVGEQGRELIVPSQNGTVIPNQLTEKMMGGKGANITIVNNPGATLDERVLSIIISNMKTIQQGVADENVRRFAPNYYQMGGA